MIQKSEEALSLLSLGEFEKAKGIYSVLLDKDPLDFFSISGYFIASYWDHRLDLILKTREGKERGTLILELFSNFEMEMGKRGYTETETYRAVQDCILKEAVEHLKLAYQWEGTNALDKNTLRELTASLLKLGDYKMALEILTFVGSRQTPILDFYLAETYCMLGREKEGIELYRASFLNDPQNFSSALVHWPPLLPLIEKAKSLSPKEEEWKEIIPVLAWREGLFRLPGKKDEDTIRTWLGELRRLLDSKQRMGENFKLSARVEQFALAILHSADDIRSRDAIQLAKDLV